MFIVCGVNHQTAPISIREKMVFPSDTQLPVLAQLTAFPEINEAALLSTCHRTELYCDVSTPQRLLPILSDVCNLPPDTLTPYFYCHQEHQGVQHALRVASGLDSMMLGESQILGQFKQTYATACQAGAASTTLKQIFPYIFRVSKRIRQQSGIGNAPVSIAYAAAQRILQTFPAATHPRVLIIGSGQIAASILTYLFDAGMRNIQISSRTEHHAQQLAAQYHATTLPIEQLATAFIEADIVITASTCPIPFVTPAFLSPVLPLRQRPALFLLDLAIPRNVSEDVSSLSHLTVCHMDDLKAICDLGRLERQAAAQQAEHLIEKELTQFMRWSDQKHTRTLIQQYRHHMQHLAAQELTQALRQLTPSAEITPILEKLTHRLLKKLTHFPTISLKQAADAGYTEIFSIANTLLATVHPDPNDHDFN